MLTKEPMSPSHSSRSRTALARGDERAFSVRTCAALTGRDFILISLWHRLPRTGFAACGSGKSTHHILQESSHMSSKDLVLVSNMRLNFIRSFETF